MGKVIGLALDGVATQNGENRRKTTSPIEIEIPLHPLPLSTRTPMTITKNQLTDYPRQVRRPIQTPIHAYNRLNPPLHLLFYTNIQHIRQDLHTGILLPDVFLRGLQRRGVDVGNGKCCVAGREEMGRCETDAGCGAGNGDYAAGEGGHCDVVNWVVGKGSVGARDRNGPGEGNVGADSIARAEEAG